ncbi:hypothetical protein BDEG_24538 [Batrachochytrium dendrobatidis JEL423]|nr:hypothetical protein BDEG_24538 [Batrachochytrium dendrobatidis JEL423]
MEQYIADLIMKEANKKHEQYETFGTSALLSRDRLLVTNKRFLANIIRGTDAHNENLAHQEQRDAAKRLARLDSGDVSEPVSQTTKLHGSRSSLSPSKPIQKKLLTNQSYSNDDCNSISTESRQETVKECRKIRGRGATGPRSLDRFFQDKYLPGLDINNFDDESLDVYVDNLEKLKQATPRKRCISQDSDSLDSTLDHCTVNTERDEMTSTNSHNDSRKRKHKSKTRKVKKQSKKSKHSKHSDSEDNQSTRTKKSKKSKERQNASSPNARLGQVMDKSSHSTPVLPATCPW